MEAGVVALDGAGKILALNSTAREILAVADTAGAAPSSELLQRLPGLVDRDIPDAENTFDFRAGSPRIVSVHAGDAPDGSRVVVLQDITEQRRAETIRRDFVANASHELRTPVAVMQANAETLLAGALDDKAAARGFVEGMHRHARRLSALLADLLDLSRIEAGRYALDLETLDVNEAFLRARDTVSGRAQDEGVTVLQTADHALVVLGDARALDQVLVNLLDNAIKYSRPGSTVELVGEDTPAGVRLQVRDQGPGIPEEHRARLFERFYRVDPGRDRRIGGTGLGLAIVKHLGAAMGGAVGMHPNESVGSVFWISLPRP
jgi:two-component system phosphate regulon sensor histidine kinase PhoR